MKKFLVLVLLGLIVSSAAMAGYYRNSSPTYRRNNYGTSRCPSGTHNSNGICR